MGRFATEVPIFITNLLKFLMEMGSFRVGIGSANCTVKSGKLSRMIQPNA
jgi:hypothetical protein